MVWVLPSCVAHVLRNLWWLILNIKPTRMPSLVGVAELVIKILQLLSLSELKRSTAEKGVAVDLAPKQVQPEAEVGVYPQESLAQVDENGNVEDGIGIEMDEVKTIEEKETTEKPMTEVKRISY